MKGTRNVKIVYGFGSNVAFVLALLIATMWAACNTHMMAKVNTMPRLHVPHHASPIPAAVPTGRIIPQQKVAATIQSTKIG